MPILTGRAYRAAQPGSPVRLDYLPEVGPHITEPLMLIFDAEVHYRIAMAPEELAAAGLEKYTTT